ncbi:MAG: aminopeptidase [Candidatus Thermoplasmatota archaeon]|nr:aminopeptidase [Euryarchaeota archaeon]MBU4031914.1 aminopeptidase [Candidatus Thermoplasmatota archaeon]MBU4072190.1 aminopeptidase [Candidatus Thermoplasmatota archaeon]MBU4145008.1 aminopeptidase [Candidatus Thermoplasmatota archaeon]MBU4592022.1 aminopeptidase [Candidatus Thermoplasmatota archaeon]
MAISDGAKVTIETCLNVRKGERVLVLTDDSKEAIAQHLYLASLNIGAETILAKVPDLLRDGQEPPVSIARLMKEMDVVVITTEKTMSHTAARRRATRAGARIATMPGITVQMMDEGGMTADFKEIRRSIFRVARKLRKSRILRIVSEIGTDLRMDITGRAWITDDSGICQRKGDFTNLPAGELFICPLEGSASGTLMVDGSFMERLQEPVKVSVKGGIADRITGAHDVVKELNKGGRDARNIAKFGMGLNPNAKLAGIVLEDSKVLGTVNIGFGDNSMFGGSVKSSVHLLGILNKPTVTVDNVLIMKEGELKA